MLPLVLGVGILLVNIGYGHTFGQDFRGGMWKAGQAIVSGQSPYPRPDAHVLLRELYGYVPPPLFALAAVPLALLPWAAAIAVWNVVSISAFVWALYLVGVRDRRVYALALSSLPFVLSLGFGQTEGVLALGLAAAWRWRDSLPGSVAVGAVIAAKLIVWPLLVWLIITRRVRSACAALGVAVVMLSVSWAVIGFKGLASYPRLLAADAQAFSGRTHSATALLMGMGLSRQPAELLTVLVAAALGAVAMYRARGDDRSLFFIAVAMSLLASPMLEMHYVALLFIPLAILRPRLDGLWLFAANVFWLSPHDPASEWQIALVLLAVGLLMLRATQERVVRASPPARAIPATPPVHATA